jgi:hypothetical protein
MLRSLENISAGRFILKKDIQQFPHLDISQTKISKDAVFHKLINNYKLYFPQMATEPKIVDEIIQQNALSFIIRWELKSGDKKVKIVVKLPREDVASGVVEKEYKSLELLYERFQEFQRFSVPKPICYWPEYPAIVLVKVDGENLSKLIKEKANRFSTQNEIQFAAKSCYFCGEWLSVFHKVTRQHNGRYVLNSESFIPTISEKLRECSKLGIAKNLQNRIINVLKVRLNKYQGESLIVTGQHSDFVPWNVLISPGKINVLDFAGLKSGPIYEDLSLFLGTIESLPRYWRYSHTVAEKLQKSFVNGYGEDKISTGILELFLIKSMIKLLTWLKEDVSFNRIPLHKKLYAGWLRKKSIEFYISWLKRIAYGKKS